MKRVARSSSIIFSDTLLYSTVIILSKYHIAMFVMWSVSFFGGQFFANGSIIQNISFGVGIILGLLTIISKSWSMIQEYHRKSLRDEIQKVIQNRQLDSETEEALRQITNE